MNKDAVYIVVDIEADGPVAGLYSMLSIGAVATTEDKEIGEFYRKLTPLESASQDPDTMQWWKGEPEAWEEVHTDQEPPQKVMEDFSSWVQGLHQEPIFVAHPIAFDYAFVNWYLFRFTGESPFQGNAPARQTLDLTSFASGTLNTSLDRSRRQNLPASMLGNVKHTHKAIDDARGYAHLLRALLKHHRQAAD